MSSEQGITFATYYYLLYHFYRTETIEYDAKNEWEKADKSYTLEDKYYGKYLIKAGFVS